MAGRTASGMRSAASTFGSHPEPSPWTSPVTPALEASVTCSAPPDRVQATQVSTVPKASSPRSARERSGSAWSRMAASLVAEALGATRMPWPWSSRQVPTVRRSCQPSPGATGTPVARSHTMVEARWLAMPTASTGPPSARLAEATSTTAAAMAAASNSTSPGKGVSGSTGTWWMWADLAVGAHHRPPHPGGAHVDHQDAHGQGTGPKGEVRPSLPGLRIPRGSRASLTEASTSKAGPSAPAQEAGPVEADAVVVADGPPGARGGLGDPVPGLPVVVVDPGGASPLGAVGCSASGGRPAKVK